ncbi:hypothetical protein [Bacillus toyonensis]|nr:hypothetical protein [Bacillus toyonensis]
MRERLLELIDTYNKKLKLPVDNITKEYYSGKIAGYEHAIILLDKTKEVI